MAVESLYRPIWSEQILAELVERDTLKRIKRGAERDHAEVAARRLVTTMDEAFDDSCVAGWEGLVGTYGLPDPDDEHVVAAAVVGGAGAIVTSNHKDFPTTLVPKTITIVDPARFAADAASVDPERAFAAIDAMVKRYANPPSTAYEVLGALERRYGMHEAVALLRAQRE